MRRLLTATAVIAVTTLLWVLLPLWVVGAAALSPMLPGRWRALRLLWIFILYATIDSLMLVVMFGYWLAAGGSRRVRAPYWQGLHYDLVQGMMWVLFREAKRVLRLDIVTEGPTPDAHPGQPLLVCCRHAGPGDSFTLIHALMYWYDREPRVVLKDTLQWDPAIDVLLHRIPARFISPNPAEGQDLESQITALATGLDENDAFVIFPEGGNFTAKRRDRAIARLRKLGLEGMAGAGRGDDQRAGTATGRLPRGAGRGPRGRRRPGRAHRPRPPAHRRRHLARAAHGQADRDALVAGAARGDPGRPGGQDRLAVQPLGGDRRLDRREPPSLPARYCFLGASSTGGLEVHDLGRLVRGARRVRLVGRVGERLVRACGAGVVGRRGAGAGVGT